MTLPTAIDRYQIREALGQGGMGTLFLALDPAIDRLVALKVLRVDNPDVRERFAREARLAARLQHPNIVTIYDVGEHDGQPFIAMEYIPGDTLNDLIRRRAPLDLRRKLEMMIDVCAGLAYAHKHGIVHRDVKPANLIVSRDSQIVKILDFGIARAGESGLTQVGMVIGTPNYMSPEQVRGELVDHRSDIFAVGLVLYELLAYRRAFEADTQTAVLLKILNDTPPTLLSLDPGLDPAVATIVERTLAKDPSQRPPDLGALKTELSRLLYRLESTAPEERTMIVPRPMPRTGPGGLDKPPSGGTPFPARGATAPPPAEPDVAALVRDARAKMDAGALAEANTLLSRAARLDQASPAVAGAREALERALASRERDQERSRRVASAVAHGHQALEAGSFDSAIRAAGEALSLAPADPDALALRTEIQKRAPHAAVPGPPAATAPPPPVPPPLPVATEPGAFRPGAAAGRAGSRLTLAFLVAALVSAILLAVAAVFVWRQMSGGTATTRQTTTAPVPSPPPSTGEAAPVRPPDPVAPSRPAESPARPAADPTAVVTARLAEAIRLFDEEKTAAALDGLGELLDEAPQREDLRETAERWARALERRAQEARAQVPKPRSGTWPPPLRAANQLVRTGELQLQSGDVLAAARSFEQGRAAWNQLAQTAPGRRSRGDGPGARVDAAPDAEPRPARPEPEPRPVRPEPAPAEPRGPGSAARLTARPAEPPAAAPAPAPGPAPEEAAVRDAINRTLASFERAFESRSAESLRPIWPSLSGGELQAFQSQFSRVLFQQWTFNTRDIRVGPNGNRAVAQCSVTVSILEPGARDTRIESRTVRFELERLGPMWVLVSVSGV